MPYIKRFVHPLYLSNKPLPKGCRTELESVANNSLCGLIRQLSDISDLASGIFEEITVEANLVNERTHVLKVRVGKLAEYVSKLDARAVKVPESSLANFKQQREHFRSQGSPERSRCTAVSRPPCVSVQYNNACTNLKDVYDKLKEYHDKEEETCSICVSTTMLACSSEAERSEYDFQFPRLTLSPASNIMGWAMVTKELRANTVATAPSFRANTAPTVLVMQQQEKYILHKPIINHSPKQRRRRPMALSIKKSPRPHSEADILEDYFKRTRSPLPTPEEVMRQNVTPSSVMPIDVTGAGFERMASFRRSYTPQVKKERKKRRSLWRRTITGIPDAMHGEMIHENGWRSDTSISEQASSVEYELKTQSLDRRSFRKHHKEQREKCQQDVAVVTPLRTRRKPRRVNASAPVVPTLVGNSKDKDTIVSATHDKQAARLSLPLEKLSSVNGSNDSSLDKVWMASSPVRPKSLEFTAQQLQQMGAITPPDQAGRQSRISTHYAQQAAYAIPNAIIPTTAVTRTINTQRTTVAGSLEPVTNESLPNALYSTYATSSSTMVRLRETKSIAKKEERQSSSGNWSGSGSGSGTDSTRTSVNSDVGQALSVDGCDSSTISPSDSALSLSTENVVTVTSSGMHDSLQSVDSALGNGTVPRPYKLALPVDSTSDLSGSPTPTNTISQIDTENWLKTVGNTGEMQSKEGEKGNEAPDNKSPPGIIQIGFPDNASDSSSSENPSSSQNLSDTASVDLEVFLGDGNSFDSDSLSSFSVDTEGYWTSMHSDCGLPKHGGPGRGKPSKRSQNVEMLSEEQQSSMESFVEGPAPAKPQRSLRVEPPSISVQQSTGKDGNDSNKELNSSLLMVPDQSGSISVSSTDTDSASEASYDLNTPAPVPPENPRMYKICYGGSNSSVDSQRSSRQDPHSRGGLTAVATSSQSSLDSSQLSSSAGSLTGQTSQVPSISSPSSSDSGVHLQVTSPTGSGQPPRPPMIPLGQMTVQQAQQQKLQSQMKGKIMIQSAKDAFFQGGAQGGNSDSSSQVTPVSSPTTLSQRVELMSQRSPMSPQSMYPEKYNTLQRRARIQAGWEVEGQQHEGNIPDTSQLLMSPTQPAGRDVSPQDRQQLFQDYVNTLQNQAPQNYSSIGGLADYCNGRQSALTREQRAEILDLMRRSKHSRPAASPMEMRSSDPNYASLPASFRSSYHEGIESGHLDPDMAIIRAAEQLEQNRTEMSPSPLQPLQTKLTSPDGDLPFLGPTPSSSPKIIPDETRTPLYIFDPNRQPKNGILKARKPAKSKGKSDELEARIHAAKKKLNIHTDPFAKQGNRPMSPSESSSDSSGSVNTRSISFSDTVHVDNTPIKVCSVSGKPPQTSIDDFKALLQTRQKLFRPFTAAERLSSNIAAQQPLPKSRLDEMLETELDDSSTAERRIVTVYDLRNAMASARSSTRTNDLRLPYQQLQMLKQKSAQPDGTVSNEGALGGVTDLNKAQDANSSEKKAGLRETDLRFLSPDDRDDPQIQEIMDKMDEDEKKEKRKKEQMEKGLPSKMEELKIEEPIPQTKVTDISRESKKSSENDQTAATTPKQLVSPVSPHDDPSRKKLLESILERGQRKDSRQEAIKMLESLKTIHEKPELTIEVATPTDSSITTLLDNMKTQIPHRYLPEMPTSPNSSEHEYGADAWD